MHLETPQAPPDSPAQRKADRARLLRALNASLAFVLLLAAVFAAQSLAAFDWRPFTVEPLAPAGLWGVLSAPLLHGSIEHLGANAVSLLLLGTLAGSVYPRTTLRALPLIWLGSGLGAWLLGAPGSHHLGASGLTHGLMFLVFVFGLLRRDRPAVAAAMIAFLLYGGMLLTVLPREAGVSWESHLGGALAGAVSALLFRHQDPKAPRHKYSWEIEEELAAEAAAEERDQFEPPRPQEVPVLWQRAPEPRGVVLRFPPREPPSDANG
ncbi:rhomboid family intramembrane serine protease [Luteimonas aquatica]|uniref:rhomboid family intramembrane serine protease n=1 Tax=Luteimonas aquatica TaxID=450364 RepID=UPI001F5651BA|nr:rhomboid family intramembrane serine protease [Luteimonas aquatica]